MTRNQWLAIGCTIGIAGCALASFAGAMLYGLLRLAWIIFSLS